MHILQDCLPLSHTRLSVTNDPNIFQAVDVISIAEFSRDLCINEHIVSICRRQRRYPNS